MSSLQDVAVLTFPLPPARWWVLDVHGPPFQPKINGADGRKDVFQLSEG